MRKLFYALVLVISGCSTGSHLTFGPATVSSRVGAHEYREPKFYFNPNDSGYVGSTLAWFSSEVGGKLHSCNSVDLSLWVNWDQKDDAGNKVDPWVYPDAKSTVQRTVVTDLTPTVNVAPFSVTTTGNNTNTLYLNAVTVP